MERKRQRAAEGRVRVAECGGGSGEGDERRGAQQRMEVRGAERYGECQRKDGEKERGRRKRDGKNE